MSYSPEDSLSSRQPRRRWKLAALAASLLAAAGLCLAPAAASAATPAPAFGPVPHGFAATSATFTSAAQGYVLGAAPCAPNHVCTSIVRTADRGGHWQGTHAPVVSLGDPRSATGNSVWGIRFATWNYGFVFGTGLWETTDGGNHWAPVSSPATSILSLAVSNGQLLALTKPCRPGNCTNQNATLYRHPLNGGSWHLVAHVAEGGNEPTDLISTQANLAVVQNGSWLLVTANGGLSYSMQLLNCNRGTHSNPQQPADVAAVAAHDAALLCAGGAAAGSTQKYLYLSGNRGASWHYAGMAPFGGDPFDLAGVPGHYVVAAVSGASWLYYSGNGAHWSTALVEGDGGMGFADLGFTTHSDGAVVRAPVYSNHNSFGAPGWLMLTSNGGASWHRVTF